MIIMKIMAWSEQMIARDIMTFARLLYPYIKYNTFFFSLYLVLAVLPYIPQKWDGRKKKVTHWRISDEEEITDWTILYIYLYIYIQKVCYIKVKADASPLFYTRSSASNNLPSGADIYKADKREVERRIRKKSQRSSIRRRIEWRNMVAVELNGPIQRHHRIRLIIQYIYLTSYCIYIYSLNFIYVLCYILISIEAILL